MKAPHQNGFIVQMNTFLPIRLPHCYRLSRLNVETVMSFKRSCTTPMAGAAYPALHLFLMYEPIPN